MDVDVHLSSCGKVRVSECDSELKEEVIVGILLLFQLTVIGSWSACVHFGNVDKEDGC